MNCLTTFYLFLPLKLIFGAIFAFLTIILLVKIFEYFSDDLKNETPVEVQNIFGADTRRLPLLEIVIIVAIPFAAIVAFLVLKFFPQGTFECIF